MARRHARLRLDDLARLRAPLKTLLPFVQVLDHHPRAMLDDADKLRSRLAPPPKQASLFA